MKQESPSVTNTKRAFFAKNKVVQGFFFALLFCLSMSPAQLLFAAQSGNNPFLSQKAPALHTHDGKTKAVMIVMDASGSMSEPAVGAASKMIQAKQVLEQVLSRIDGSVPVGLRVYGSSRPANDDVIDCQDSILLVPVGTGNRAQMINKLRELKPNGKTPISFALRKAVQDLQYVEAEEKNIVLISDGMETCGSDPCALAASFKERGVNIKFNVVGYNVNSDYLAQSQLECIAKSTDGRFVNAETSAELADGILEGINYSTSVVKSVSGKLSDEEE